MKNQALFSSKDKCKKLKCRLLQLLFSAFRVNLPLIGTDYTHQSITTSSKAPVSLITGLITLASSHIGAVVLILN